MAAIPRLAVWRIGAARLCSARRSPSWQRPAGRGTGGRAGGTVCGSRRDLHETHRAHLPAQLRELPSPGWRGPDGAQHLRGGAAVGALDQAARQHRPARRSDAAVVRRARAWDPEVQERPVALARRRSPWSAAGSTPARPAATPPTCRRPGCGTTAPAGRSASPTWSCGPRRCTVKAGAPDWWGEIAPTPTGLTEDRYVSAVEVREVNDVEVSGSGRHTVGGRYVFHHMIWQTRPLDQKDELDPTDPFGLAALTGQSRRHHHLARARGGARARLLRSEVRPPAEGRVVDHLRLGPPALQRARHEGPPRGRLQVHAEGLQAGVSSPRASRSATAWTSTSRATSRARNCTPMPC